MTSTATISGILAEFVTLGSGFQFSGNVLIGGTVNRILENRGSLAWDIYGITINATDIQAALQAADGQQSQILLAAILSGNDSFYLSESSDNASGFGGNDELTGNGGADSLYGGADNDRLIGNAGKDRLYGEAGADWFIFFETADSKVGKARDRILDFNRAELDLIVLDDIDASTKLADDQDFVFIGGKAFSKKAGELRFDDKILSGDVNGDGKADFEIEIAGVKKLFVTDFDL